MAKTIMVSDAVYAKLKEIKPEGTSFSELFTGLMESSSGAKNGGTLIKFFGILKGDTEFDRIQKEMKPKWKEWDKRYA